MSAKCLNLLVFLLFLFFSSPAFSASYLDPTLKFNTIETPHFSIHYYDKVKDMAEKMPKIAEDVYSRLTPILKHTPNIKTEIVMLDTSDYTNGLTTVTPFPNVILYVSDISSNSAPLAYEVWLKYVFLHEYTHVLHLDTVTGDGKPIQDYMGRMVFPNAFEPNFMTEGMATYFETEHGYGEGRARDPHFTAMMRMDVLEDNIKSIEQAGIGTVKFPEGNCFYVYGAEFFEYIAQTYGEDKLVDISQEYGNYFLSSGLDGVTKKIFNKNFNELWDEWLAALRIKYAKEKHYLEKEGLTTISKLTSDGYYNFKPKWSSDSKSIFFNKRNENEYPSISEIEVSTLKEKKLMDAIVSDDNLAVRGNKLYFSKADYFKNFYIFKDLYSLDLITGKTERLSNGGRNTDPAVSYDGKKLAYVHNENGKRTLWENQRQLGSNTKDVQYLSPAYSPDGRYLVAAKRDNRLPQAIFLIDMATSLEKKLFSLGQSSNPSFSPDGKYIIFDSDVSGIVNLFAYNLSSKKFFKITNVLGCAMMPDVSPDGKRIAYVNLSSKGYDVAVLNYEPNKWKEYEPGTADNNSFFKEEAATKSTEDLNGIISNSTESPTKSTTFETTVHPYNPLPTLSPKLWVPVFYFDNFGAYAQFNTFGVDALRQHAYQFSFVADSYSKRATYYLHYLNDQFLPQLSLLVGDFVNTYNWDNNSTLYLERDMYLSAGMTFIGNHVFSVYDKQAFSLGGEIQNLANITNLGTLTNKPTIGVLKGINLGYQYSNSRSYGYSISQEDGEELVAQSLFYTKQLGSSFNITHHYLAINKYLPLGGHKALAILSNANFYSGDSLVQPGFSFQYQQIRGYNSTKLPGSKMAKVSTELRFPISLLESGFGYGATFFDKLWGAFFLDLGNAAYDSLSSTPLKKSIGAELNLSTLSAYGYVPLTFKVGIAEGLDQGGETQIYFNLTM